MKETLDKYGKLWIDPWCIYPDDKMFKAFRGLIEKYPNCPLCNGKFGFLDNSGIPPTSVSDFRIQCMSSINGKHDFYADVKRRPKFNKLNKQYISKTANFILRVDDIMINWHSGYEPDKVSIIFNPFPLQSIKVNFGGMENWFIPKEQLRNKINKYGMLL